MHVKTTLTLIGGAGILAGLGYIDQTCPQFDWTKLAMVVVGAVWGAWNLHRDKPAPPAGQ